MDDDAVPCLSSDTVEFSTSAAPFSERPLRWREHLADVYFGLEVDPADGERLDGALLKRSLSNLKVSQLRGSTQRMVRTVEHAKNDRIESYVFISPAAGTFDYADHKTYGRASQGQVFALSSADFHEVAISNNSSMICLEVPARLIADRAMRVERFRAQGVLSDPLVSSLIRTMGDDILHRNTLTSIQHIEKICMDLLEVAVGTRTRHPIQGAPSQILDDAIYNRFVHVVASSYHDPRFNLTRCSAACGVSKRHLQGVLKAKGTSFTEEMLSTRLSQAERLIKASRNERMAIGRIAASCGFANQSYFSTCYRRRYGLSPREDRFGW